jgi:VIT1/CCC1 family predicted Fe2+/Mn2+ transporter
MRRLLRDPLYVRNIVFGVEDSLVSTVGLLSGVATGHATQAAVLSTGVIYIFVEALSMAVGSFLSEESVSALRGGETKPWRAMLGGLVMFVSFVVAGFIPLIPYVVMQGYAYTALAWSITISLATLFVLGLVPAQAKGVSRLLRALRMALLGGLAIVVGVVIGSFFGS